MAPRSTSPPPTTPAAGEWCAHALHDEVVGVRALVSGLVLDNVGVATHALHIVDLACKVLLAEFRILGVDKLGLRAARAVRAQRRSLLRARAPGPCSRGGGSGACLAFFRSRGMYTRPPVRRLWRQCARGAAGRTANCCLVFLCVTICTVENAPLRTIHDEACAVRPSRRTIHVTCAVVGCEHSRKYSSPCGVGAGGGNARSEVLAHGILVGQLPLIQQLIHVWHGQPLACACLASAEERWRYKLCALSTWWVQLRSGGALHCHLQVRNG